MTNIFNGNYQAQYFRLKDALEKFEKFNMATFSEEIDHVINKIKEENSFLASAQPKDYQKSPLRELKEKTIQKEGAYSWQNNNYYNSLSLDEKEEHLLAIEKEQKSVDYNNFKIQKENMKTYTAVQEFLIKLGMPTTKKITPRTKTHTVNTEWPNDLASACMINYSSIMPEFSKELTDIRNKKNEIETEKRKLANIEETKKQRRILDLKIISLVEKYALPKDTDYHNILENLAFSTPIYSVIHCVYNNKIDDAREIVQSLDISIQEYFDEFIKDNNSEKFIINLKIKKEIPVDFINDYLEAGAIKKKMDDILKVLGI